MKTCDYCGKEGEFYSTFNSRKINGTLCEKCIKHMPKDFYSDWNNTCTPEFLLILLKLSAKNVSTN